MKIPERFKEYNCREYFDSDRFNGGFYDEKTQNWTFHTSATVVERPELEFLVVGGPCCDGLEWGYRKGHVGVWVYYPIEQEFRLLASTLAELFDGWHSGRITV